MTLLVGASGGLTVKGIAFARLDGASAVDGYLAPTCALRAGASASTVAAWDGFALWAVRAELSPRSVVTWDAVHGDEAVYVLRGEVDVSGRVCPDGGVVVVEAGAAAHLTAEDGATLLHFGPSDARSETTPPGSNGRGIHVVGPRGTYAATEPGRDTRMFADSSCPTCRITLFFTGRDGPYATPRHSHSADELLCVLSGEIHFGRRRLGPGDVAAIEAGHRYAFRSDGGFGLLNYRRDGSMQTIDGDIARPEGGRVRGLTPVNDTR